MGLNLTGPADESPIKCIERLTALKRSLLYDGMGYYKGGPGDIGCDEDDMHDLNADLACAAMEALPGLLGLLALVRDRISTDGSTPKTGYGSPFFAEIRKAADAVVGREAVTA
jgi:hypothetical protein